MKRILITICTLFAWVMLSVAQGDSYKITGQVGNSVNGKLLLVALTEKGLIDIGEHWQPLCWRTRTTRLPRERMN